MVSEREDVVSLSEVNLVHSCHASSFINPYNNKGFTTKEEIRRYHTVYTMVTGNQVPSGLNLVHKQ